VCTFAINLWDEFAFNLSRKFCEINHLKISGYYPVNRLAKLKISGYVRNPDRKNIDIQTNPSLNESRDKRPVVVNAN